MRLPWGRLTEITRIFLAEMEFAILGCLSFEERCCAVPERMFSERCAGIQLLEIRDPIDAIPDHSAAASRRIDANRKRLEDGEIVFESSVAELLATEDQLLDMLASLRGSKAGRTVVLDITSLPKRYFCFFLKRMLLLDSFPNVVVTYTQPGSNGYTKDRLAEDPMTCDHLPGFAAPLPPKGNTLVVSVGFESLSIRSLLEVYRDKKRDTKIISSFPTDGLSVRREWLTLMAIVSGEVQDVNLDNLEVVAAWDAEMVYRVLKRWNQDADGLTLAPFGPKPHTLGMAIFAIRHDSGLYYTQPKSYNPDYSRGVGESWAYVVKWNGIPCFDRRSTNH